ncbi:hypothetical protein VNO77_16421 [Canavalia gladiata]|uniref:Uncharacterized protein n=1 Tax=Canavalia gladiata TaxID=3824 RepID=A0AAN9M0C8_CANGL
MAKVFDMAMHYFSWGPYYIRFDLEFILSSQVKDFPFACHWGKDKKDSDGPDGDPSLMMNLGKLEHMCDPAKRSLYHHIPVDTSLSDGFPTSSFSLLLFKSKKDMEKEGSGGKHKMQYEELLTMIRREALHYTTTLFEYKKESSRAAFLLHLSLSLWKMIAKMFSMVAISLASFDFDFMIFHILYGLWWLAEFDVLIPHSGSATSCCVTNL